MRISVPRPYWPRFKKQEIVFKKINYAACDSRTKPCFAALDLLLQTNIDYF